MRQAHSSNGATAASSTAPQDAPAHSSNGATASSSHAAGPAPGQPPTAAAAFGGGGGGTPRPAEPGGDSVLSSAREAEHVAAPQQQGGLGSEAHTAEHTPTLGGVPAAAAQSRAEHADTTPAGVAAARGADAPMHQQGLGEARASALSSAAEARGSEPAGQQAPSAGALPHPEQWEDEPAWLALDEVYYGLMAGNRQLVFRLRPGQPTWLVWEVRCVRSLAIGGKCRGRWLQVQPESV